MLGIPEQNSANGRLHQKSGRTGGKLNLIKIVTGIPDQNYKDRYDAIDWSTRNEQEDREEKA